jgi:hypothetical protein
MEQEEYKSEEINWSYIEVIDNQDVLDLIEKVVSLPLLTDIGSFSATLIHFRTTCVQWLAVLVSVSGWNLLPARLLRWWGILWRLGYALRTLAKRV